MKLALVSGGSRGLGAALCAELARQDFTVVEFSRSAPHPFSVPCDFGVPESVAACMESRLRDFAGQPLQELVVISNAATLDPIGPSSSLNASAIQHNLNVSLVSAIVFLACAQSLFQSQACRKTLVSISSGAAVKGYAGWSLYCAAKAGLENHLRAITLEQAGHPAPFRVLNINPGVMDTTMQATIRQRTAADFPSVERFMALHRDGALQDPAEIAGAILRIIGSELASGSSIQAADFLARTG